MSRVANKPIVVPASVQLTQSERTLSVKGNKGELGLNLHDLVDIEIDANVIKVKALAESKQAQAMSGTTRALISNMVNGVNQGFDKKLELVGVGYRAQVKGDVLNLSLGFSHPIDFPIPEGITIETPTQTEIMVRGTDKQKVGQVAANIRAFRPPEPYKGKGVRYANESVRRKEAKKKK